MAVRVSLRKSADLSCSDGEVGDGASPGASQMSESEGATAAEASAADTTGAVATAEAETAAPEATAAARKRKPKAKAKSKSKQKPLRKPADDVVAATAAPPAACGGVVMPPPPPLPHAISHSACSKLTLPQDDDTPRCSYCNQVVDILKARISGKQATGLKYKCPSCNTKHVGLCRKFGQWPIDEFKLLSREEQQEFWKQGSERTLQEQVSRILEKKYMEERRVSEGGSYLPLGCYVVQGFNAQAVEASPNRKWHDGLGEWVYKIDIETSSKAKIAQEVQGHILRLTEAADRKRSQGRGRGGPAMAASDPGGEPRTASTSSSSSSSKKKKKDKKKKKKKKKKDDSHAAKVKALEA